MVGYRQNKPSNPDAEFFITIVTNNYNPVKHGIVNAPRDWEHSSFHNYVKRGIYPDYWGDGVEIDVPGAEYD